MPVARTRLEVVLSPLEFAPLSKRELSRATCVVFDILRATSSMITALARGAESIVPVGEIGEALQMREKDSKVLLAGEREGLRITGKLTGSVDFDFGNSPREFTEQAVKGRRIVMTTTNGTRALRACAAAREVLVSSFLNLSATAEWLRQNPPGHLVVICSGTHDEPALEDMLAAGALCEQIWGLYQWGEVSDGAECVRRLFEEAQAELADSLAAARNARRLLALPDLAADVPFCLQRDVFPFVARLEKNGAVRRVS
ncbi:MAG TPA: 2-phosphosulfolactate phosphatase [Verrucomicrobiae bacterium]|jgi:2-phosphosulfolactate phosphatase